MDLMDEVLIQIEEQIEFDGTTVLCRVCGDKASGFHYGVHSCEGCKGFFRRSIQQKIQYRPCTKNQQCSILRINRNRCQYCRLKKCIAVGMSRDAVRFGRVPKREKAKILAAMQSVNARSQEKALTNELEDESKLIASIIQAHNETCDFTRDKVRPMLEQARSQPVYTTCPPQMACPLNPNPHPLQNGQSHIMEDFSERFSPAIRGVVEFAKRIPGFNLLSQDDQVTLLKAGVFEVLLVRLACMFDSTTNTMVCLNGQLVKRDSVSCASNARFLMDSMFDFSERLNGLKLTENELALFCSIVVIAVDRPGLRNLELVEKMHTKLIQALQTTVETHHPHNPILFQELMKKIPDLRTLNTLHSEKLLAFKMEPRNKAACESTFVASADDHWNRYADKWSSSMVHQNVGPWSPSSDPFGSPRSIDSSQGVKSPSSSSKGFDCESVCSVEVAQINELNVRHHDEQSASGDEHDGPRCPFKMRKLDSPTDSGIESGKEHAAHSTPTASICSSPRSSMDDKVKDISDSEVPDKTESIDDMPVLKRALQAPPLINTNLLMDEAYKPHKKFRAFRKDSSDGPCSPESSSNCNQPTTKAPLASMHSTLVQTLQQGPKYLNEQQMKRTDFIHNMIMTNDAKSSAPCNTLYHPQQHHPHQQFQHPHHQNVSSGHFIPSSSVVSSSSTKSNVPTYIPHHPSSSWPPMSHSQSIPVFVKNSRATAKSPMTTTTTTSAQQQQIIPRMYYDPRNQSSSSSSSSQSSPPPQSVVVNPSFTTTSILAAQLAAPLNTVAPSKNISPPNGHIRLNAEHHQQPLNLSKRTPSPPPLNA